jgi:uncharacterized protein (TIGR03437 family)
MDAAYNTFKKTALLFAIALLSAAPSFGQASANPISVTLTGSNSPTVSITGPSGIAFTVTGTQPTVPFYSFTPSNGTFGTSAISLSVSLINTSCNFTSTCNGTITVHPENNSGDATIAVNYNPAGGGGGSGNVISVPTSVSLTTAIGGSNFQDLQVSTTSTSVITYSISSPTTTDGHSWLFVGASPGYTNQVSSGFPSSLRVSVFASSLPNGTYSGSFVVTPSSGNAITVQVTMVVGTGGSGGSFSPNTTAVFFAYPSGTQNYTVTFGNTSAGSYTASVSSSNGWLNAPSSGQLANGLPISLTSNAAVLATGNYTGTVSLNDGSIINVYLTVNGASNGNFSPSSLTFNASLLAAPQSQTVTVGNVSSISYPDCQTWVGVAQTGTNTYLVTVYPTALSTAGVYTCNVSFGTPGTLPVTLNLGTSGGGGGGTVSGLIAPTTLNFAYAVGGDSPPLQYVTISGSGTYTISTSPSGTTNFISASGTGTAPGQIGVGVVGGLPAGTYSGAISIATSSGTQSVAVNLTVAAGAVVMANPGSFNISWQPGSGNTVSSLSIYASDGSAVPITVASSANWVTLAGVTSTTTPASAQVTINPAGLANGLNSATITVTATGAANTKVTIPVVALVSGSSGGGSGNLTLSASSLTFNAIVNGAQPASQTLGVSTSATGTAFTASVPSSGCGWLTVSPVGNLVTNQNLTVSVNQAGYAVNTYSCNITLTSGGLTQTVPVSMVVSSSGSGGGSGNVSVSPASLTFTYTQGGEAPGLQGIVVSSSSGSSNVGITTSVTSGSSWLSVTPTQAATQVTLSVSVNVTGLDAGTYSGNIRISPNGGTAVNIPVTLTVQSLTVTATPATLTFSYRAGDPAPAAQTVSVAGGTGLTFSASASSSGWLNVTPTTGTTPADLSVTVDPASLTTAGQQTGTITVTGTGTATGTATVTVTINVTAPLPTISGVTNGASFAPSSTISAGEIITIFGTNIGPSTPVGLTLDSNGNVSNTIGGVQVLVGGYPSPMIYASGTQVSAVVPYEIASPVFRVSPSVQVKYLGQTSNGVQVTQVASVPGLFTANASGTGPGAILNSNNSVNSPSNPASKGDTVVIYMTGEGQTNPAGVTGKVTTVNPSGNPLTPQPLLPVAVLVDGQPAKVVFYGEAPGIVSGVMQVNVQIPTTAATGNLSVSVQVGSNISQTGVTVSVK